MAKATSKKTTDIAKQISKSQFAELAATVSPDDLDGVRDMFKAAKMVNVSELKKIAGDDYAELLDGETYVFICQGILGNALPSKSDPNKLVSAVSLMTEDGANVINADRVLVSTIERETISGTEWPKMIMIHVKGLKKSAKGDYKDLEIFLY